MDLRGEGTSNKIYVSINDPFKGRVKMTLEEFAQSYSGICMMMNPSENFETGGEPASILEFAKQRLTGTLPMFLMITSTTLIAAMTNILLPAFSRFFVDYLLINNTPRWVSGFFLLLSLVIASQIASLWIKTTSMLKLQGKMAAIANTSFLWHILRLPIEFFEQRMAGDIVQRQLSNQDITNTLINTFAPLILDSAAMIFNLLIMINYSPLLASVGILAVIINLTIAKIISDKRIDITRVQMRDTANLNITCKKSPTSLRGR